MMTSELSGLAAMALDAFAGTFVGTIISHFLPLPPWRRRQPRA